jgi:AcrR family transcriptional regulator
VNQNSKNEGRAGPQLREKVRGLVRDELLQAAEAVFAEEGLQTAKVESIAARAGVSVGTVYNYFSDRKALLDAVFESRREQLWKRLQELSAETDGCPFLERLERSIVAVFDYFEAQRPYIVLMLQADSPLLRQAMAPQRDPANGPFAPLHLHLESLIAQGIAEGALRNEDPRRLGLFLLGICKGMCLTTLARAEPLDLAQVRDATLRFFLHGAGPIPQGG